MIVFWWQGRGYQTLLVLVLTLFAFGVIATVGKPYIPERPWYWAAAFCVAALINWKRGTALNAKSLAKRRPSTLMKRLFYNARHRFMSMPMETFSFVLLLAGMGIALYPVLFPASTVR